MHAEARKAGDNEHTIIEIHTRARGVVHCRSDDIIPLRFGLLLQQRRIILEYRIQGKDVLAHHYIDVVVPEHGQEVPPAELALQLQREHVPWLQQIATSQLEALVERLSRQRPVEVSTPAAAPAIRPLAAAEAKELKVLLLGDGSRVLPEAWLQAWCFEAESTATCPYGLRQAEGGPCGVIAPVQAFLLQRLLSGSISPVAATPAQRWTALLDALTEILWRCRPAQDAAARLLVLPEGKSPASCLQSPAGCNIWECQEWQGLRSAWELEAVRASYFEGGSLCRAGTVLLLYSALATRGAARVRLDADIPGEVTMIGAHSYCTQEAVNLLLTGAACSNVFDGEQLVGGSKETGEDGLKLRGVAQRSDVGFLSLFEAFDSLKVGDHLKHPTWPVWVVHAESHYSVLFGLCPESASSAGADSETDVWYYDPLGRQDEEKRITVRPHALADPPDEDDIDSNGMIAKVIRTRWGAKADLDWNGAEPIY